MNLSLGFVYKTTFSLFQELDKEFGDDPEETEIPDFDADRFSTKSPELQTRTPSPDDPDEHYEMDIDYQDGNSNDKAETLRIDKTIKGKIYIYPILNGQRLKKVSRIPSLFIDNAHKSQYKSNTYFGSRSQFQTI